MILDATFWVTVSFFIFLGILVYFKIPQKIKTTLDQNGKEISEGKVKDLNLADWGRKEIKIAETENINLDNLSSKEKEYLWLKAKKSTKHNLS